MFTPDQLASAVQQTLSTQVIPPEHKLAVFGAMTTSGAKAAVAYRPSANHDWTINVYDDFDFKAGNTAGIAFKGSF